MQCFHCSAKFKDVIQLVEHEGVCKREQRLRQLERIADEQERHVASLFIYPSQLSGLGDAHQVAGLLFIGNSSAARDAEWLRRERIDLVLNCARDVQPPRQLYEGLGIQLLHLELDDSSSERLVDRVQQQNALDAIDAAKRPLIHCAAGQSRSVTVALMYLVDRKGYSLRDAWVAIRGARAIAYPNLNFWTQLREFEGKGTITPAMLAIHEESV